jgi:tetratricopeptide (TPR) repeat protein
MTQQIIDLKCPGCGQPWTIADKTCKSCNRPVIISTFNSVYSMPLPEINKYTSVYKQALTDNPNNSDLNRGLAMCYLKLKLYSKALAAFEKAIEVDFNDSETYFYAAVCLLEGKKAYLSVRPVIDKIEEYINAALMLEPRGIYYYFQAYIKYDYFSRKFFRTTPTYQDVLKMANANGVSQFDIEQLYSILGVSRPECL